MSGMATEDGPIKLVTSMESGMLMGDVRDEVMGYRLLLLVKKGGLMVTIDVLVEQG